MAFFLSALEGAAMTILSFSPTRTWQDICSFVFHQCEGCFCLGAQDWEEEITYLSVPREACCVMRLDVAL